MTGVTLNAPAQQPGGASPSGTFTVGNLLTYNLPRGGVVLSSGDVADYATGPNTNGFQTTSFGLPETPAQAAILNPITGNFRHFDVAELIINFDLQPGFDTLFFELAFGSEEYPEFVNSSFVDGFGLIVNGTNIAQVNGSPVNIDHPQMAPIAGTELDGVLAPNGSPRLLFTQVLTDGQTGNTLDIIVADTSDTALDTTVYVSSLGAARAQ